MWLGNLLGTELPRLRAAVPGAPPPHCRHDPGDLPDLVTVERGGDAGSAAVTDAVRAALERA